MKKISEYHQSGVSVDDAVALLTASLGDQINLSHQMRLAIMQELAQGPNAGARVMAALETLAVMTAGIIEEYVQECGDDPESVIAHFALIDNLRRPR